MILRPVQLVPGQAARFQSLIGVAGKGHHRRARDLLLRVVLKGTEAVPVEPRQIVAQTHE